MSAHRVPLDVTGPLEAVEIPSRLSMTLLQRDDLCPRSAYLGLKYRDAGGTHAMDRGSLFHASVERLMKDLMRSGERQLAPEDPAQAAALTAAIVDETLRANPQLVVPRAEVDDVREMMFHVASGYDVDPQTIAGLEQLMVLDLDCGWTISGRLDLIALPSAELGQIDDWKTSRALPSQDEYERSMQPWTYAVLLCYGTPVRHEDCPVCPIEQRTVITDCEVCEGKGYVEVRGEPFGKHLRGVLTREVFPHPKPRDDGLLHHRELLLSRTAIADFRADLETKAVRLAERFKTWDFPARSSGGSENGSWCSRCPASQECPLPETLRDFAGSINTLDQATEAWTKTQHAKALIAAVEREVKNYAKAHDVAIRVGDQEWRWQPKEGRALKRSGRGSDWPGLEEAIREATQFGTPFRVDDWIVPTVSNGFVKSKVASEGER